MKEHILKYYEQAKNFNEALPIGNGTLGAMVYGSLPIEKLTLNHDTLWSGSPHTYVREGAREAYIRACKKTDEGDLFEAERIIEEEFTGPFTDSYLPLGTLYYELKDDIGKDYVRFLDMSQGIAVAKTSTVCIEHLASYDYKCIASRITFLKQSDLKITLVSEIKNQSYIEGNTICLTGQCPAVVKDGQEPVYDGTGIEFATFVKVKTDGIVRACDGSLSVENATYAEIFVTVATSFINHRDISDKTYETRAAYNAVKCVAAGYDTIKQKQTEYYNKHYGSVELTLSDNPNQEDTLTRLMSDKKDVGLVELLFNFGRYLTIASSAKGSQATNLQGIWNEQLCAIWKSNYTVNINTEMNYWHTLMCGLSDFHYPVIDLVKKISDTGRTTAKEFYGANGYVCHHNIDLWGNTVAVSGIGDEHIVGNSNFSYWCGAAGWLCRNVFEYYEYTLDKEFLRDTAYPLMKGAAEFYLSILRPVGDRIAISPATSPENHYVVNGEYHSMGKWTTMTQSIVADLFANCVKACDILDIDSDWKQTLVDIIPQLKPFEVGSDGRMLEWDTEVTERDKEHRHVSHLYGLYPADMITTDATPELAEACKKSLEIRGDEGTGWALAWKACLWAKLKDGDHALKMIRRQLDVIDSEHTSCELWGGGTYPNLFCAHPPFQIDGNFGITAAIAMLFLQCEDGVIKILPALPKSFSNGKIKGLVAKGNIKVDIEWENNRTKGITLVSPVPQNVTVMFDDKKINVSLCSEIEKNIAL